MSKDFTTQFPKIAQGDIIYQPIAIDVDPIGYNDCICIDDGYLWKVHNCKDTVITRQNLTDGSMFEWKLDFLNVLVARYYKGKLWMIVCPDKCKLVSWQPGSELEYYPKVAIPNIPNGLYNKYTYHGKFIYVKSIGNDYLLDLDNLKVIRIRLLRIPNYNNADQVILYKDRLLCVEKNYNWFDFLDFNIITKTYHTYKFSIGYGYEKIWLHDDNLYLIGYDGIINLSDNKVIRPRADVPTYLTFNGIQKILIDDNYIYMTSASERYSGFDIYSIKMKNEVISVPPSIKGKIIQLCDDHNNNHDVDVSYLQGSEMYEVMINGQWKNDNVINVPYSDHHIHSWATTMANKPKDTDILTLIYAIPLLDYFFQKDKLIKVMDYLAVEIKSADTYVQLWKTCHEITSCHQLMFCLFHCVQMTKDDILELMDINRELLAECIITKECEYKFNVNTSNSKIDYAVCTGTYGSGSVFKYPMMIFKK